MSLKNTLTKLVANGEFRVKSYSNDTGRNIDEVICTAEAATVLKSLGIEVSNEGMRRAFPRHDLSKYNHLVKIANYMRGGPEPDALITHLDSWEAINEFFAKFPSLPPKSALLPSQGPERRVKLSECH